MTHLTGRIPAPHDSIASWCDAGRLEITPRVVQSLADLAPVRADLDTEGRIACEVPGLRPPYTDNEGWTHRVRFAELRAAGEPIAYPDTKVRITGDTVDLLEATWGADA